MTIFADSFEHKLSQQAAAAVRAAFGPELAFEGRWIARSGDEKFGDYQFNGAMPLSKALKQPPRTIAEQLLPHLRLDELFEPPTIAGPGFINFTLKAAAVAAKLAAIPAAGSDEDRLGIPPVATPQTVVIDMSSPNLAKEMHVGHVRSTVIGDSIARILEFAGHQVQRINHVGDWGTQFGMLVAHLRHARPEVLEQPDQFALSDLEAFYVEAKKHFDGDPDFATEARRTVVALQSGDAATLRIWKAFCAESLRHCRKIYARLGIDGLLERGESFYNDRLAAVVQELTDKGLVVESDGAQCIFLEGFKNRDGEPLPMIIRKSDGGYLYATTDLAAIRYRIKDLGGQRLIYVVGSPQKQVFDLLFAAAGKAGWAGEDVALVHLAFGQLLGPDGRPFKTREGNAVKLVDLLDEAVQRARAVLVEGSGFRVQGSESAPSADLSSTDWEPLTSAAADVKGRSAGAAARRDLTPEQVDEIAQTIGIGAVKYFDLSHALTTDYRFDWDTMLSLKGNTAPYMLYAYARIRSIARKAGIDFATIPADTPIVLDHANELRLGKLLLRFGEVVAQAGQELRPNLLTDYLFELSERFSLFYDRKHGVRVIDAEPESLRLSRLRLCDLTARTLQRGLSLLGIGTVEQM